MRRNTTFIVGPQNYMGIKQLWEAELICLYQYMIIGIFFNVDMLRLMTLSLHSCHESND